MRTQRNSQTKLSWQKSAEKRICEEHVTKNFQNMQIIQRSNFLSFTRKDYPPCLTILTLIQQPSRCAIMKYVCVHSFCLCDMRLNPQYLTVTCQTAVLGEIALLWSLARSWIPSFKVSLQVFWQYWQDIVGQWSTFNAQPGGEEAAVQHAACSSAMAERDHMSLLSRVCHSPEPPNVS